MISEGQTRSHLVVLKLGLKEFLSSYVKKFTVYIWSSAMKRNFSKHLDIIAEKIGVLFPTSRILDQTFYFKNDHFLPEKPDKHSDDILGARMLWKPKEAIILKNFIDQPV
jgi:hypothetical protein